VVDRWLRHPNHEKVLLIDGIYFVAFGYRSRPRRSPFLG
jgi:hypothetical protein